jgi:cellulose synthase/poly-beta-1,6-N-acetylglucosamine synthase-like glycosyltransferase
MIVFLALCQFDQYWVMGFNIGMKKNKSKANKSKVQQSSDNTKSESIDSLRIAPQARDDKAFGSNKTITDSIFRSTQDDDNAGSMKKVKTIEQERTNWKYRFFESFTGMTAIIFITTMLVLAVLAPSILAIFLIIYSFFIVLKSGLHTIYTFYTFKNIYRWEDVIWLELIDLMNKKPKLAIEEMTKIGKQYPDKFNWGTNWLEFIETYKQNLDTKFQNLNGLHHCIFVPIYNENVDTMILSLERVYNSGYPLDKIWLVVAREGRAGNDFNNGMKEKLEGLDWINVLELDNNASEFSHLARRQPQQKLQVILTKHPEDLHGEIKGKGSNLDWSGRQVSQLAMVNKLDQETTVMTVLDCDSRPGRSFFQILSFRYCLTQDRHNVGFQPIPVFTNNYFDSTLLSSLVASGTTLWNFVQSSIPEEIHHFANYSVSLKLLRETNFWVKDLVSEDSLFFDKNFCELHGEYRSLPTFAYFESDVVESPTFGEALLNQYKQLRRWAYGGVEGMSYLGRRLVLEDEGKLVDNRKKIQILYNEWIGHFLWSTMPFVFGFVMFLPALLNTKFADSVIASNLNFFSQSFSVISYLIVIINGIIISNYIQSRFAHQKKQMNRYQYLDIILQTLLSPLFFSLWFIPPIEAQLRGVFGKYLGFWVTPKGGDGESEVG